MIAEDYSKSQHHQMNHISKDVFLVKGSLGLSFNTLSSITTQTVLVYN